MPIKGGGGVTAHDILSSTHTDAEVAAALRGALIYGNSTPKWSRLAIGAADRLLKSDGADVDWGQLTLGMISDSLITVAKLAQVPACRLRNSANQSIANATWTNLTFDTEDFDTDSMHSLVTGTDRITIATAGIYSIGGNVEWQANATGFRNQAIYLNNATYIAVSKFPVSSSASTTITTIATLTELIVGDYVTMRVYQNSSNALNCSAYAEYAPCFWAVRVSV